MHMQPHICTIPQNNSIVKKQKKAFFCVCALLASTEKYFQYMNAYYGVNIVKISENNPRRKDKYMFNLKKLKFNKIIILDIL